METAGIDLTLTVHSFSKPSNLSHLFCINIHVCFLLCLFQVNWVSSSSTPPLFSSRGRHFDGEFTVKSWIWGLGFVTGGEGAVLYLCQCLCAVSGPLFPVPWEPGTRPLLSQGWMMAARGSLAPSVLRCGVLLKGASAGLNPRPAPPSALSQGV